MSDTDMLYMASLQKRLADIEAENTELKARIAELEGKHWNECRQIAHYSNEATQGINQWISIEERLPIECGPVLCYARDTSGEGNVRILGTLRNGEFWFLQVDGTQFSFPNLCLEVTHWMPLPEPPKEE